MAQKQSKAKTRMAEVRARLKKPAKRAKATAAPKAYSVPGQPHGSAGPKKAIVQDLVSRPVSGTLKKKMGLPIHSAKSSDGARTYRITSK
jgi:hypothetical protein